MVLTESVNLLKMYAKLYAQQAPGERDLRLQPNPWGGGPPSKHASTYAAVRSGGQPSSLTSTRPSPSGAVFLTPHDFLGWCHFSSGDAVKALNAGAPRSSCLTALLIAAVSLSLKPSSCGRSQHLNPKSCCGVRTNTGVCPTSTPIIWIFTVTVQKSYPLYWLSKWKVMDM